MNFEETLFKMLTEAINEDTRFHITGSGFFYIEDSSIFFIHHSMVCFKVEENNTSYLNIPNAGKNFIKNCFSDMYCDTIKWLLKSGDILPISEKYIQHMFKITGFEKKRKENKLWKTLDIEKTCMQDTG